MPPRYFLSKRPEGQPTRGKTTSNRLRRVDNFLTLYDSRLIQRTDDEFLNAFFVDLGYGAEAITTLESARRLRRLNPSLPILGVEIDPERVAVALPHSDARTVFRLGGFNLPLRPGENVRLIRAFNVLRQYEEREFAPAYERLSESVLPEGLMIEGTSDPFGKIWAANVVRKRAAGWAFEALVFSTNFRSGFDPADFQAVLPKNYIQHVVPGEWIYGFFEAWKRAAADTASVKSFGLRQWFAACAEALVSRGYAADLHRKWLTKGWLIVDPSKGV